MLHYSIYLVWLGALVQILGSAAYIRDTLKGNTKPNRVTWFFWAVAPLIGAAAALAAGVRWAVLPVVVIGIMPLAIFFASFTNKHAYWQLGKLDYICGFFSALALILWLITSEPKVAIVLAIVADAWAAIPTLKKSWTNPETETSVEYAASIFAAVTALLAIQNFSMSEIAWPIYLVILNGLILISIYQNKLKGLLPPRVH